MLGQHRGIIFDLDGTLVDSQLDFSLLCQQLGWPAGTAILEHLATLTDKVERSRAERIICDFEMQGAASASWIDGAEALLWHLQQQGIPTAILTRNMRAASQLCRERLSMPVSLWLTREDAPAKPDPTGLHLIAQHWQLPVQQLLFVGDYWFDLATARAAGMPSCLLLNGTNQHFAEDADYCIRHFIELHQLY